MKEEFQKENRKKEEFYKYIEILKQKTNWNSRNESSVSQIKNSVERFIRLDQIEDRISGLEDKVDILEHSDEVVEKRKYKWNMQDL
jgi:hypothetical protein